MGEGIRIGRIAGIDTWVDWTIVLVFGLIAWNLHANWLVQSGTEVDSATTARQVVLWGAAVAGATLFYGCLLAHELTHAVVAKRYGIEVRSITLWLFGGVAQMENEPQTAGQELRIAVAGPITSILLGAGFLSAALLGSALGAPEVLRVLLVWLGVVNVVLGVFNLVPAFPLDGGRVLRAIVWSVTGDRARATRAAVSSGRVFAYVLMGLGAVEVLGGGAIGGIWLVFLGWFILMAGRSEGYVSSLDRLRELPVRNVMTADPACVDGRVSVAAFAEGLWEQRYSAFPVLDEQGRPIGLVDLHAVRAVPRQRWESTTLSDIVVPLSRLPLVSADEPVLALVGRLGRHGQRRTLVLDDDGRLLGIVSATDLARLIDHAEVVDRLKRVS